MFSNKEDNKKLSGYIFNQQFDNMRPEKKTDLQIITERYRNDVFIKGCWDQIRKINESEPIIFITTKDGNTERIISDETLLIIAKIHLFMNDYIKIAYPLICITTSPDK